MSMPRGLLWERLQPRALRPIIRDPWLKVLALPLRRQGAGKGWPRFELIQKAPLPSPPVPSQGGGTSSTPRLRRRRGHGLRLLPALDPRHQRRYVLGDTPPHKALPGRGGYVARKRKGGVE